jgi:hypothetical protein
MRRYMDDDSWMRLLLACLAGLLAAPALAQAPASSGTSAPPAPSRWQASAGELCIMSLSDRPQDWRLRVEIVRLRSGRTMFRVRVPDSAVEAPAEGARVRLIWSTIAFGDRNFTIPVSRVLPRTDRRPMTVDLQPAPGAGLDRMVDQARRSTTLKVGLPTVETPYQLVSLGFAEAWSALDECVQRPG